MGAAGMMGSLETNPYFQKNPDRSHSKLLTQFLEDTDGSSATKTPTAIPVTPERTLFMKLQGAWTSF